MPPVWRTWGGNPALGKAHEWQLIDLGQQKPSVGSSVLEGSTDPQAGIWQKLRCPQSGGELSKAGLCGKHQPTSWLVLVRPKRSALVHFPSKVHLSDHRCKNICLPVSFCSSCSSVAVLHYKYLVTSFMLCSLTYWRGCVGRAIRATFVNLELSQGSLAFCSWNIHCWVAQWNHHLVWSAQVWQTRIDCSQTGVCIAFAIYQTIFFSSWLATACATEMESCHLLQTNADKVTPT